MKGEVNNVKEAEQLEKNIISDLFLDFHGEGIKELVINGYNVPHKEIVFRKHRVYLG